MAGHERLNTFILLTHPLPTKTKNPSRSRGFLGKSSWPGSISACDLLPGKRRAW